MKRIGIAVLLLSGLYTHAQLWACKHAMAQKVDQALPDGSVIHRRLFSFPQCIGADQQATDWVHDGPCKATATSTSSGKCISKGMSPMLKPAQS